MFNFVEIEDKELEKIEDDFFESRKYIELLENKITDNDKFNVLGLYGKWGRGKTTIVKAVEKNIVEKNNENYIFINYDAWKYNGNSFKRMFLIEIAKVIDNKNNNSNEINKLKRKLYNTQSTTLGKEKIFYSAFIFLFIFFLLVLYILLGKKEFEVGISLSILGMLSIMEWVFKFLKFTSGTVTNTITEHPTVHPEEFEKLFNEMFDIFNKKKVVIVIDNLDRCPSADAYEVLSSIKCFFNEKNNLMMIIPLDETAIKEHIKKQFDGNDIDASEYISKIINSNISLHSPNFIKQYEYIDWLCEENKIAFSEKLKLIIAEMDFTNPRQIISFMNSLCNELNLYSKEEINDKEHLVALVLFLKNKFPKIYNRVKIGDNPGNDYGDERAFPTRIDKYFKSYYMKDMVFFSNKQKENSYYYQDYNGDNFKNELTNNGYKYAHIQNLENLSKTIDEFVTSNQDIAIECIEKMIEILLGLEDKTFYYDGIYELLNEIIMNYRSSDIEVLSINKVFEKINDKNNFIKYSYINYMKGYKDILKLIIDSINTDKNPDMVKVFCDEINDIELLSKINFDL